MEKPIIIALGGSVIVPELSEDKGINTIFLKKFRKLILENFKKGKSFIIVAGGGKTTRVYQKAASKIAKINKEDLDWIGIHTTRLNAHLLRTIFQKEACPIVLDDPRKKIGKIKKNILIASGWRPGWSTDYISVLLAKRFKVKEVIIAGDTPFVYDKDPKKYKEAKPIKDISFKQYKKLIPKKWTPGLSSPLDPVATKMAQEIDLKINIINANNLKSFKNIFCGKKFEGTVISKTE